MGKQYNSIDLFKLLFAFVVISIHTHPLENSTVEWAVRINEVINNLAVPFFFIASGFLLGNKFDFTNNNSDKTIIKKQGIHLLRLYIIWMILYTPLAIIHNVEIRVSFITAIKSYIIGLVFVGEQYNSWVLWYLLASVYALFALYMLPRNLTKKKLIWIMVCSSFISAMCAWYGDYDGNLNGIMLIVYKMVRMIFSSGRIFKGLIYIPVGIFLSKERIRIPICATMFLIGFVANYFIINSFICTFLLIITSVGLFGCMLEMKLPDIRIYPVMRDMSTTIYFIHLYVWTLYYFVFYRTKTYGMDCFIITGIISSLIALMVWCLKQKIKFSKDFTKK